MLEEKTTPKKGKTKPPLIHWWYYDRANNLYRSKCALKRTPSEFKRHKASPHKSEVTCIVCKELA